jgi:hypothetical protein
MALKARANWEDNFSNDHFFKYLIDSLEEILDSLPTANLGRQIEYAVGITGELVAERMRPMLGRMRRFWR